MRVRERTIGTVFGDEEIAAVRSVLQSGESPSWGSERDAFEREFRDFCGAAHAVATSSCTAALNLCAQLLRLGPDDEIIATPQSFWATIAALVSRGVRIRFGDIDPTTLNLSPESVERLIGPRTRAIYLMHHGGNPADLRLIRQIAADRKVVVVEDCAHAVGARYEGGMIGDGQLCCFSFQSLKNMSTLGEGGMLTTNNEEWAAQAASLRIMGALGKTRPRTSRSTGPYPDPAFNLYDHSTFPPLASSADRGELLELQELGTKCYMSAVHAAVGRVQLRRLPQLNAARARIAQRYSDFLATVEGLAPVRVAAGNTSAWHLYSCLISPECGIRRDELIFHLQEVSGVEIVLRYWPLHLNAVLAPLGHRFGEAPVCERVWFEQQLNLPICAAMHSWEVDVVLQALEAAMRACRR